MGARLRMFLYRVKVEELDTAALLALKADIERHEQDLRAQCPIREMSVVGEDGSELDIYLALDDVIGAEELKRLGSELEAVLDQGAGCPHVSSELIHI
jgi:hypothetical protein